MQSSLCLRFLLQHFGWHNSKTKQTTVEIFNDASEQHSLHGHWSNSGCWWCRDQGQNGRNWSCVRVFPGYLVADSDDWLWAMAFMGYIFLCKTRSFFLALFNSMPLCLSFRIFSGSENFCMERLFQWKGSAEWRWMPLAWSEIHSLQVWLARLIWKQITWIVANCFRLQATYRVFMKVLRLVRFR